MSVDQIASGSHSPAGWHGLPLRPPLRQVLSRPLELAVGQFAESARVVARDAAASLRARCASDSR